MAGPDGTPGDTSAGRILEAALAKATEIDIRVRSAAGPKATSRLDVVRDHYFEARHRPYKGKKPWKGSNRTQIEDNLTRCLRGFEDYRAMDVDRAPCDRMRAQAGTVQMVRINTVILRAFLAWGEQNRYFTPLQAELLTRACSMPAPALKRTASRVRDDDDRAADAGDHARMNGQSERYVRDEDAPSRDRVVALCSAAAALPELGRPRRGAGGQRWPAMGRAVQLTAPDTHLDGCVEYRGAHIHVDWQVDDIGSATGAAGPGPRVTRPR